MNFVTNKIRLLHPHINNNSRYCIRLIHAPLILYSGDNVGHINLISKEIDELIYNEISIPVYDKIIRRLALPIFRSMIPTYTF